MKRKAYAVLAVLLLSFALSAPAAYAAPEKAVAFFSLEEVAEWVESVVTDLWQAVIEEANGKKDPHLDEPQTQSLEEECESLKDCVEEESQPQIDPWG